MELSQWACVAKGKSAAELMKAKGVSFSHLRCPYCQHNIKFGLDSFQPLLDCDNCRHISEVSLTVITPQEQLNNNPNKRDYAFYADLLRMD